jgi:hypothetical protein
MAKKGWSINLEGESHRVEVEHGYWSGTTALSVDGGTILRVAPGFGGFADHWWGPSEQSTTFGRHELRVRVTPNIGYSLDLIVDGRSASTGALLSSLPQPPADAFYRLGKLGASIAMIAVPYTIAITFLFGRFAPQWGPRWFAANDIALASGVLPLMAGLGLYLINVIRVPSELGTRLGTRLFWLAFGLGCLWIAGGVALTLPRDIEDVVRTPETRTVAVVAVTDTRGAAPSIRTADGATYEWVWSFGQFKYPRIEPGTYEIVITPVRQRVVAIRAVP